MEVEMGSGPDQERPASNSSGSARAQSLEIVAIKAGNPAVAKGKPARVFQFDMWTLCLFFFIYVQLFVLMIFVGAYRGWTSNALQIYPDPSINDTRFLPEPSNNRSIDDLTIEEVGVAGRYGPGASGRWYYWRLRPADVNAATRAFVWICYLTHQFSIWWIIYRSQQVKVGYTKGLHWFNVAALVVNLFFHLLHFAQTHITYGALAEDVSISSSQGSVICLLVFVILLEYKDRGMMMGWPTAQHDSKAARALRLNPSVIQVVRKYHGYGFAWAACYTFWYHPMESTWGHFVGFMYTAILLLQGSMIHSLPSFAQVHRGPLEQILESAE
mmetsp:Transcript_10730/g.28140  ORF Transcript_10730/g.28140 Transcript_10730/m.28140 type:complete len:328 (+) Transcript_10730:164-1147(+)